MASQHGSRFDSPMFNQNFPPNIYNMIPGTERPPGPQFQSSSTPSSGSFQSSERFVHGFQNSPQFSNFTGACGFMNRPPPPPLTLATRPPPVPASNLFPGALNSHLPFPSQPSGPSPSSFSSRPPPPHDLANHNVPHHPHSAPSPVPSHPPPPLPQPPFTSPPHFPPHQSISEQNLYPNLSHASQQNQFQPMSQLPQQNQFQPMSQPPQFQPMSLPPQQNQFQSMPQPPQQNQFQPMSHLPQQNRFQPMSHPLQQNQFQPMSHPPQQNQFQPMSPPPKNRFQSMSHPPQQNQFQSMSPPSQQNQFQPVSPTPKNRFRQSKDSHHPQQQEEFHMNSSSSAPRPRFRNSFLHQYKPWNQMRRNGSRTPFSKQSPNVVKSHQFKDTSQQVKTKKQKSREFKKLKDDSTDKPFSCDTCDRAFVSESELNDHISLHIKCDYENCTFEAHPKIVLLHKKMQHETGYADRISKLKDDAEVKKWREERKKRFPTAENIRKRQAEQAEREARGEVLETKEFGKFKRQRDEDSNLSNNRRRRIRGHRGKRNHFRRDFTVQHPGFQQFKVNSESDSDCDSHISLHMFSGLSSLVNSGEEMCHVDTIVETNSSDQNLPKSTSNLDENHLNVSHSENNLTELPYLSNAEELRDDAKHIDESVLEIPENEIEKSKKELVVIEDSDDESPEVIKIFKSQEVDVEEKDKTRPKVSGDAVEISKMNHEDTRKNKKSRLDVKDKPQISEMHHEEINKGNQFSRKEAKFNGFSTEKNDANKIRKNSLLEKLLADDIRHERNVILQCIRHIVNNNFFGLAVKKS